MENEEEEGEEELEKGGAGRGGRGRKVQAEVISLYDHPTGPQAPHPPPAPLPTSSDSSTLHPLPPPPLRPPAHTACPEAAGAGDAGGSVVWVCVRVRSATKDGYLHPSKLQGVLALHRTQVCLLDVLRVDVLWSVPRELADLILQGWTCGLGIIV